MMLGKNCNVPCLWDRGSATDVCKYFMYCITSHLHNCEIRYYKVNMLLTDIQNLSISDLGCHGHPEAVSGWGWAARCRGYHPPRGRRPRCSICAAGAATMTSALACSAGSVRCTSTGHLDTHTHTHTDIDFSQLPYFPMCDNDVNNESYNAGRCVFWGFIQS